MGMTLLSLQEIDFSPAGLQEVKMLWHRVLTSLVCLKWNGMLRFNEESSLMQNCKFSPEKLAPRSLNLLPSLPLHSVVSVFPNRKYVDLGTEIVDSRWDVCRLCQSLKDSKQKSKSSSKIGCWNLSYALCVWKWLCVSSGKNQIDVFKVCIWRYNVKEGPWP